MGDLKPPLIRSVRAGHAPNCSSAGSVISIALVSAVAAGVVVNMWADRLLRWLEADPSNGSDDQPSGDGPLDTVRLRQEADGALVAWPDPPAVLDVGPALARRLQQRGASVVGRPTTPPPGALSAPTEVHLAVTDRCPASCTGCYLSAGPDQAITEPGDLVERLDELAAMGVFEVAFGGGEALLRDDLFALARHARAVGMVPNLTTSGFGVSAPRAIEMARLFGQVNVSLDGLGDAYTASRGWDGADRGLTALRTLVGAGVRCGVNTVLTRHLLDHPDDLAALGDTIAHAGAREWQWLRYKPAGRGATAWDQLAPASHQLDDIFEFALRLEARTGLTMRFDCALVPFVAHAVGDTDRLRQLGVVGCPGGQGLWARSADGRWAPCSFAAGAANTGPLHQAWVHNETLTRWRDRAAGPPEPCASCTVATVCRGGCRVVAAHVTGDAMAPDPQCPRVRGVV